MKYSMVKQFSNAAIDNVFKFVFKIVDFGKLMIDVFWAFFDIWYSFFMIFYNMFLYVYYIFLFLLDMGTESQPRFLFWRRGNVRLMRTPKITIQDLPNPVSGRYGSSVVKVSSAASTTVSAVSAAVKSMPSMPSMQMKPGASGARINYTKKGLEAIEIIFTGIKKAILKPFRLIASFFETKARAEEEKGTAKSKSLIDEYMKEYEQKRKG